MEKKMQDANVIVFSSHDLSATRNLCNKIIRLEKGQIRLSESPDDVINAYQQQLSTQVLTT